MLFVVCFACSVHYPLSDHGSKMVDGGSNTSDYIFWIQIKGSKRSLRRLLLTTVCLIHLKYTYFIYLIEVLIKTKNSPLFEVRPSCVKVP